MRKFVKKGIGAEGIIQKNFAALVRQYEGYKILDCAWWSYDSSGEARNAVTASLLKAKGLRGGKSDFEFIKNKICGRKSDNSPIYETHFIFIEFKKPKTATSAAGKQSESQKEFEDVFKDSVNCRYYMAYSVEEGIKILEKENILKGK